MPGTLPAVTGKVTDVEPSGTVTIVGMLAPAGNELRAMVAPPLEGAKVSATLQVDTAGGTINVESQENPFKLGVGAIVTVPLPADVGKDDPSGLAAIP